MINLLYCCLTEPTGKHPQDVMKDLGITYKHSTPQSMFDSWQFWRCENVPKELPDFLTPIKYPPEHYIGIGLNNLMADKITNNDF